MIQQGFNYNFVNNLIINCDIKGLDNLEKNDLENYKLLNEYLDLTQLSTLSLIKIFDILHSKDPSFLSRSNCEGDNIMLTFAYRHNVEICKYLLEKGLSINSSGMYDSVLAGASQNFEFLKFAQDNGINICYLDQSCIFLHGQRYRNCCYLCELINNLKNESELKCVKNLIDIGSHKYSKTPYANLLNFTKNIYKENKNVRFDLLQKVISYIENAIKNCENFVFNFENTQAIVGQDEFKYDGIYRIYENYKIVENVFKEEEIKPIEKPISFIIYSFDDDTKEDLIKFLNVFVNTKLIIFYMLDKNCDLFETYNYIKKNYPNIKCIPIFTFEEA